MDRNLGHLDADRARLTKTEPRDSHAVYLAGFDGASVTGNTIWHTEAPNEPGTVRGVGVLAFGGDDGSQILVTGNLVKGLVLEGDPNPIATFTSNLIDDVLT